MFWQISLQIVLILLNAVFSGAETALVSANPNRLEKLSAEGNGKAEKFLELADEQTKVISAVRLAVTLSGFTGAAFCAENFASRLVSFAVGAGLAGYENLLRPLSLIIITFLLSCITIVFGELVPKRIALKNPEKLALSIVGLLGATKSFFSPLVLIMNFSADMISKIFGVTSDGGNDAITEEEIIMMSDAGAEKGTIDEDENRIIKNIFAFDDMTAEQICTHRTDVSVLWSSDPVETWEETIHRTRHSRFPVCGENIDHIVGILNAKDFFSLDDKSRENIMKNAVHEPYFVHENMKADNLFAQMKKHGGHHFAVVVDEYGGMSGIVTVTDLVEQLVGDFDDDELNPPTEEIMKINENEWIIHGSANLADVCEELNMSLPADKYDTFGGYVISFLEEIPKNGSNILLECDGLEIRILEIHHHRIKACSVIKSDKKKAV